MNIFIFIIISITLGICFAFYKFINKSLKNISVEEINSKLFQQQFSEIKSDFERGLIENDEYALMEKELSKRVLSYSSNNKKTDVYQNKQLLNLSIVIILLILIFITFFYLFL